MFDKVKTFGKKYGAAGGLAFVGVTGARMLGLGKLGSAFAGVGAAIAGVYAADKLGFSK